MYAITGITGKVGGELARNFLAAGQRVRAIVRNASKSRATIRFQRITDAEASAVTQWSSAALMSFPPPAVSNRRLSVVCVAKSIAISSDVTLG